MRILSVRKIDLIRRAASEAATCPGHGAARHLVVLHISECGTDETQDRRLPPRWTQQLVQKSFRLPGRAGHFSARQIARNAREWMTVGLSVAPETVHTVRRNNAVVCVVRVLRVGSAVRDYTCGTVLLSRKRPRPDGRGRNSGDPFAGREMAATSIVSDPLRAVLRRQVAGLLFAFSAAARWVFGRDRLGPSGEHS